MKYLSLARLVYLFDREPRLPRTPGQLTPRTPGQLIAVSCHSYESIFNLIVVEKCILIHAIYDICT